MFTFVLQDVRAAGRRIILMHITHFRDGDFYSCLAGCLGAACTLAV